MHEHLGCHAGARRRRDGGEALQELLGLVAGTEEISEAQPLRLALQRRVKAGLRACAGC
jgi:hypothetical protein